METETPDMLNPAAEIDQPLFLEMPQDNNYTEKYLKI